MKYALLYPPVSKGLECRCLEERIHLPIPPFPNSGNHIRRSPRDNEIEQPLRRSSQRNIQGPEPRSRDLGDVDPAHRTPSELEEDGEEVDAHNGDVASGRYSGAFHWGLDANVNSDVIHAEALGDGGPEETFAATERIRCQGEEEGAADHFEHAVDACGEEGRLGAIEAEVGEYLGGLDDERH